MYIANKLRKQNITAYIIYMFQVEDIIRAFDLDIDRLAAEYLPHFGLTDAQRTEEKEWYGALARMMQEEGAVKKGHVQVVKNTMVLLSERHGELLSDPKQAAYSAIYYKALPYIVELRAKSHAQGKDEIENCLEAVYGATVLKMQHREISEETRRALRPITNLLETLSSLYKTQPTE